ncbi:MAG: response regulator [Myxococcales bacterium]|nr:response regulator [Myxococcales bacterium]
MRVLIVEDSDSICRMMEALISARGYSVRSASNGARGIEEALSFKPHVVLLDINLPGSYDGIQVCEKLRADDTTRDVPIIMVSAMTDEEIKRRASDAGATAYYEKPFSPLSLLKEIERLAKASGASSSA